LLKKTASPNVIFKTFKMNFSFKNIFAFLALAFFVVSCRTTDSDEIIPTTNTELDGFLKIKEITNETHIIELYSKTGKTQLGYNDLRLRIKNKSTNQYENAANVKWTPLMNMATMSHSCPKSTLQKISNNSNVYGGYLVFQMPENEMEGWTLKIDYSVGTSDYSATGNLKVPASTKKNVNVFLGSDNVKYVVAYVEPTSPKVATNDLTLGVWKMQDMMNFPVVDGFSVKVDPRMPGMGNHSSPNNVAATQTAAGGFYKGKMSLTMTGYWKINLQLLNQQGTVLKGEEVSDTNPASSLFFELDF